MEKPKQKKAKPRDKEEVRLENPVPSLLARYGVKTRGNRYVPFCHAYTSNAASAFSGKFGQDYCQCFVCNKTFDCFEIVGFFEGISNLNDQVKFLGGEDTNEDDPKRIALKKKAAEIKKAQLEEKMLQEAKTEILRNISDEKNTIRKLMADEPMGKDGFPSREWVKYYNRLQYLDYKWDVFFSGEDTGGDISYMAEVKGAMQPAVHIPVMAVMT